MFKKLLILSSVFILSGCHTHLNKMTLLREPVKNTERYNYLDEDYLSFKDKLRGFSSRLSDSFVKREFKENSNITLSPLSIELCLGLAIRSASNNTREELLKAFDIDYDSFNQFYKMYFNQMSREIYSQDKLVSELLLTNSIWIDNDITLLDSGLDALRDDYYCYSYHADFNKDNRNSNKAIQEFIKDKTKGLINPKLKLSELTLLVLMNTLYLKDLWNDYGDNLQYVSKDIEFTNRDKSVSKKQLLDGYHFLGKTITTDDYSSFFTETDHGYRLYFVKPNEGKDLKDIFNKDTLNYVLDKNNLIIKDDIKREIYHTECYFPEFKAECDLDLKDMLIEDFDVKDLFDIDKCDFTNLVNGDIAIYCQEVRHIAKLDVNKKGIEGAAITMMAMGGAAAPDEIPYTDVYETFIVDKEFGYILTNSDNDVIFSGTVTNIDY